MNKITNEQRLTKKEITLLIKIINQSEIFSNPEIEDCRKWYGENQRTVKFQANTISEKLAYMKKHHSKFLPPPVAPKVYSPTSI